MFELIIKDIMEVAGYLPIGILCGCIAVVVYLVYTVSPAGKKVSAGGRVRKSIVWFLLVVYLVVMAVTVFLSREPGSRQGIDMTLFLFLHSAAKERRTPAVFPGRKADFPTMRIFSAAASVLTLHRRS